MLERLVALAHLLQVQADLDVGVELERRGRGDLRVGLVGALGLLHPVERVGQRQPGERVVGGEVERQPQVDHRGQFVALRRARGAQPVQHLGGALLGVADQPGERLAVLELVEGVAHQRVARRELVEVGIGLDRQVGAAEARLDPGVGVDDAQGVAVGLVGGLEAPLGLGVVAGHRGDQAGMVVAEGVVVALAPELVDGLQRLLAVACPGIGPGGEQRRGEIRRRARGRCGRSSGGRRPTGRP